MEPPFIETDLLSLEPIADDEEDDIRFLNAYLNSSEMRPHLGRRKPITVEKERERIREKKANGALCLLITKDEKRVGYIGLSPLWEQENNYELGLWVIPEERNKGYGKTAARLIIEHAFDYYDCQRISAHHWEDNETSGKLLEAVGFQFEGEERDGWRWNGTYQSNFYYGLTRDDWKRARDSVSGERTDEGLHVGDETAGETAKRYGAFMHPIYADAIADLSGRLSRDDPVVLDAHCGVGGTPSLLADRFGDRAVIHAVEPDSDRTAVAAEAVQNDHREQVTVSNADLLSETGSYEPNQFDCLWLSEGFSPWTPNEDSFLETLIDLLADSGIVALCYGDRSRSKLLPEYPELEHRLDAVAERLSRHSEAGDTPVLPSHPIPNPMRAADLLADAGFDRVETETYSHTYDSSGDTLPEAARRWLCDLYEYTYPRLIREYLRNSDLRETPNEQLLTSRDHDALEDTLESERDSAFSAQPATHCVTAGVLVTGQFSA